MSAVSVSQSGVRPILADAVDVARRALLELEPTGVGAHLGVTAEDETAATHRFEATLSGYRGWQWAVVVAAPPGALYATVSESALLPGPDALVAPEFVPWEQRVRPGDLAPGDLLAPPADDPRLVPGYVASGDPAVDEVAVEIGLGRTKVLSREGREEAAERWYSEYGPETDMAKAAPSTCGRCGFYLPLAGALRSAFGVCGNAMGADGHVVHAEYGCGAHSDVEVPTGGGSPLYEAYDDAAFDVIPADALRKPTTEAAPDAVTGTSEAAATAEPSDRTSDTAAEPSDAAGKVATDSGESAAAVSDDVAAEPVAHDVSLPGEPAAAEDIAEPTSVAPGTDTSSDMAESASAVEPSATASDDVVAESNTVDAPDVSASGAGSEPSLGFGASATAPVVEPPAVEPGVAISGVGVESASSVEPDAPSSSEADTAEPNTVTTHDASLGSAVSEPGDAAVADLTAPSPTEPGSEDAAVPSVGTEARDAARTAGTAEPPEHSTTAADIAPLSTGADESGKASGSAATDTSGEPNAVAQGVADRSSTAAAFGSAADVVADPSTVIESAADASDVAREPIGGAADSTMDPSASGESEPNNATTESVTGPETTATAGLASTPTAVQPSAEAAASHQGSDADVAIEAGAASDAADAAIHEASATNGVEGGVAASESSADAAVSGAAAGVAPGVDRVGELGANGAVEANAAVLDLSTEVVAAQPESDTDAAGGVADFAGEADVAGGEISAVHGEAADAHGVRAGTDGGDDLDATGAGGEAGANDAATESVAAPEPTVTGVPTSVEPGAEAAVSQPGSDADIATGAGTDRGAVDTDSATAGADGVAASADSASAGIDGGAAQADDEAVGARGEGVDVGSAGGGIDGGAAQADGEAVGARGEDDSANAGADGGASAVRDAVIDAGGATADAAGGHADADGGAAGVGGEPADNERGSGPGAAARPEFGSSLQG